MNLKSKMTGLIAGLALVLIAALGTCWFLFEQMDSILKLAPANAASGGGARIMMIGLLVAGSGLSLAIFVSINGALKGLAGLAQEMGAGASEVAMAAGQVSGASQTLAQGSSEQAASIEETSATSEEITSMTRRNADNSQSAAEFMHDVDQKVVCANKAISEMVLSMHEITSSSTKIDRIIKVIDEIAFQTNILALNAAVEAACALLCAKLRTSSATTAKPMPASPARAASTAAFNAKILV